MATKKTLYSFYTAFPALPHLRSLLHSQSHPATAQTSEAVR
jgi:hypothetical protein